MREKVSRRQFSGRITSYRWPDNAPPTRIWTQSNQIQDSWGAVVAMAVGMGQAAYKLGAMYIEFENVADPDVPVTAPTYTTAEGLEYYDDLAVSPNRDYLRVPLRVAPGLSIADGYEDIFANTELGNVLSYLVKTQGTQGVHGKTFSDSVNSIVFGAAMVATPVFADPTRDVIFARAYLAPEGQIPKEPSSQVGLGWDFLFTE